jgi:predicted RecA/RadA family phage recombinase
METFVEQGESLPFVAPSGGVVSGQPYLIGSLLVVAAQSKAQGLVFQGMTHGVFLGDKVATQAFTEGQKIYWDNTARKFTSVVGSPANTLVGCSVAAIAAAVGLATNATDGTPDAISIADNVLTVNDYTAVAGKTITVTLARDGQSPLVYVITEGEDFDAETDNATTATNIAAALAALEGLGAVASQVAGSPATEVVTVTADNPVRGLVRLDGAAR